MKHAIPSVDRLFVQFGGFLRTARKRRRYTIATVAERTSLSVQTISRLEKGDTGVSVGAFLSVIWLYGLDKQLAQVLHPDSDAQGKALDHFHLPQRVRAAKAKDEYDF